MVNKRFDTKEFSFRLSIKRVDKHRKQLETETNTKIESFSKIASDIGCCTGTIRNIFRDNSKGGAEPTTILRLCEWADLNINDFYK